jgi:polyphosphate kinase
MHLEESPQEILDAIQFIVLEQQSEFARIWHNVLQELKREKIFIVSEKQLSREQQKFVTTFFEEEISQTVIPLMIENIRDFPYMRDKSIYLAVVMSRKNSAYKRKYALIEVPARSGSRFVTLPSTKPGEKQIILLEDVIRFNLPRIFSFFQYDTFSSHIVKVTKDAEYDIDYDELLSYTDKIEKAVKSRRKGKPVRFIYDKEIDPALLEYIIRRMGLTKKDHLIPGGRIHNFRHFIDFPASVFTNAPKRKKPFPHPDLSGNERVTDVIMKKDVLLSFPYHSFNAIIDLLRDAAIDPEVTTIKITAYRLAQNSKVINALINAHRNGKQVVVVLELRARFDEENNLLWKERLEEEGVKVLVGVQNMKVHAKICLIKKRANTRTIHYGFVSTGNLNEKTAEIYGDHCLLTANRNIMADVNRMFNFLANPKTGAAQLKMCKSLLISPTNMRRQLVAMINTEIKAALAGKKASIMLKLNSLSDEQLIQKIYEAALAGVEIKMVVRGIFCAYTENKKFKKPVYAVSIVDEYLEHARIMIFQNNGDEKVFISSADWMIRNLDHRLEAAVRINDSQIAAEIKDIFNIQLADTVKARILDNQLSNTYLRSKGRKIRSQAEIYQYLFLKAQKQKSSKLLT